MHNIADGDADVDAGVACDADADADVGKIGFRRPRYR